MKPPLEPTSRLWAEIFLQGSKKFLVGVILNRLQSCGKTGSDQYLVRAGVVDLDGDVQMVAVQHDKMDNMTEFNEILSRSAHLSKGDGNHYTAAAAQGGALLICKALW